MLCSGCGWQPSSVAPARERGLKYMADSNHNYEYYCRSREGAWIEIILISLEILYHLSRSREGAWIEISIPLASYVKAICRSREGAWIEIFPLLAAALAASGRSREGAWIEIISQQGL